MSESSVKDILAKFNQGNGPPLGPPPLQKPNRPTKPSNLALSRDSPPAHSVRSPPGVNGVKSSLKPQGRQPGGVNFNELNRVVLKKPPLPRPPPGELKTTESPVPLVKLNPTPKPKPPAPVRTDTALPSPTLTNFNHPSFGGATSPPPDDLSPAPHPKPTAKPFTLPKKPKPPPAPCRKDSLTKAVSPAEVSSFLHSKGPQTEDDNKENHWKNGYTSEDHAPPVSDSENSSASSLSDFPQRRTSFLHNTTKPLAPSKPVLQPLPPTYVLGSAPQKPPKPPHVSLAQFLPPDAQPQRPPKPSGLPSPSPAPPVLPARPSIPQGGGAKAKPGPPPPVPEEPGVEDSGDIYDDVEGNPPPQVHSRQPPGRPISLIQTMDSDEEELDDIYDDAESSAAPPPLPAPPTPLPHHPTVTVTGAADAPPVPSITSIPALHGSGGSSISVPPRSAEHSGSGLEEPDIYDDVSADGDHDELYEALDAHGESSAEIDMAYENEQLKRLDEKKKKEEERLKKEQEKLQKREEEKRKKKEKEDKKRKEKEEKELRKKFNIKGDISIIDEGIVLEAMDAVYDKTDLQCKQGEKIEILRKEGNPPGKWLARNPYGHYGYVDHQFVRVEGGDCGDVYDDVIADTESQEDLIIPEESSSDDDADEDNIYDAVN